MRNLITKYSEERRGIILACGPPGSGTTLTRYGILKGIDAFIFSIFSIADNSDHDVSIITEFELRDDEELTTGIERLLRLDADVLFTDEMNTQEVAETYFEYQNKLCIVSEITAPDAAAGIVKLIKLVGDPQKVADSLRVIFCQKLLRVLCDKCKDAFRPNPKLIRKVGLPPETRVLYRPLRPPAPDDDDPDDDYYVPCTKCNGTGFFGRTAIFEAIEMTDLMKDLVASNPKASEIRKQARDEKMMSYQKEALRLVAEGKTSLDELQRIFTAK